MIHKFIQSPMSQYNLKKYLTERQFSYGKVIKIAVPLIFFIFAFSKPITIIIKQRLTGDMYFSIMIIAIALYFIWQRRYELVRAPIQAKLIPGLLLTILGCFMLVAGKVSSTVLLQELSLLVAFLGLVLLLFGKHHFLLLLLPIGYLIFLFPIFEEILAIFVRDLQFITAAIASFVLKVVQFPTYQHGNLIELPHVTLDVAPACAGISHIIALLALGIFLAHLTQKTYLRKISLIILALAIGISFNGLRVALIGIWSHFYGGSIFHGTFNFLYTYFVFPVGSMLLVITAILWGKMQPKSTPAAHHTKGLNGANPKDSFKIPNQAAVLSIIVLSITALYFHSFELTPIPLKNILTNFPFSIQDLRGANSYTFENLPELKSPHQSLSRVYYDSKGQEYQVYIAYYAFQSQEDEIVNRNTDQLHQNAVEISIDINRSTPFRVKKTVYRANNHWVISYFCYFINDKSIVNRYRVKLESIINAFIKRQNNGSFVLISLKRDSSLNKDHLGPEEIALIKKFIPPINRFLTKDNFSST